MSAGRRAEPAEILPASMVDAGINSSHHHRICFLDVDGVLANHRSQLEDFDHDDPTLIHHVDNTHPPLERRCVAQLRRIIQATGCGIVVSSSWRLCTSLDNFLKESLHNEIGVVVGRDVIVGRTPSLPGQGRDAEIAAWLAVNHAGEWCILDDGHEKAFVRGGMGSSHVLTRMSVKGNRLAEGLTEKAADKAIMLLLTKRDRDSTPLHIAKPAAKPPLAETPRPAPATKSAAAVPQTDTRATNLATGHTPAAPVAKPSDHPPIPAPATVPSGIYDRAMREALKQARLAVAANNHPFGAVLLDSAGNVVLTAQNTVVTDNDPTCHAETNLVRAAAKQIPADDLGQSTLVTSTEPCPMCAGAIYWAGIGRVVFGCTGKVLGSISGEELGVSCQVVFDSGRLHKVQVEGPVLGDLAADMHRKFWPNWTGSHFGGA